MELVDRTASQGFVCGNGGRLGGQVDLLGPLDLVLQYEPSLPPIPDKLLDLTCISPHDLDPRLRPPTDTWGLEEARRLEGNKLGQTRRLWTSF